MVTTNNLSERRYDLDWMRIIAIVLLHVFHVGMFFNEWGWHIKNNETSGAFGYVMVWMHNWRMPLLLFISGAGTIFASSRRSSGQFIKERHNKLIIPLLFAMLVVVPPQIYFERIAQFAGYWDFYKSVFDFVPYPEGGSLSWHHMWFVLYLFIYSLISVPLIKFLKSGKSVNFIRGVESYLSRKYGIMSFFIVILITQILLKPYFPEETHSLINDWAYFTFCFMFFLAGVITASSNKIWDVMFEKRRMHLWFMIGSLAIMEFLFAVDWEWLQNYVPFDLRILWDVNKVFIAWLTVITCLGYCRKFLNKDHKWRKPLNEAIYPFYILHQTVIIALAFPMMNWGMGIFLKFILLFIASTVMSLVIYFLLIKPFNAIRVLFGMKPRKGINSIEKSDPVSVKYTNPGEC